jgi:hypothetical protein
MSQKSAVISRRWPARSRSPVVGREQVRDVRRESRHLLSLPSNGLEQAHVFDRDHHVVRERLDQPDLGVVERPDIAASEHN